MSLIQSAKGSALHIAESYYQAMLEGKFDNMAEHLDSNVHLISPLAAVDGKEIVVAAAQNLAKVLTKIDIRARFEEAGRAVLIYDFHMTEPKVVLRAAGMLTVKDKLITKIELFYDTTPFQEHGTAIFKDD